MIHLYMYLLGIHTVKPVHVGVLTKTINKKWDTCISLNTARDHCTTLLCYANEYMKTVEKDMKT